MKGDGNSGNKQIPYMDISTPEQFMEYCSKVEKFGMPLEAAEYILKFESNIGGRFYVKQDVLHVVFREGTILKTGFKTNLCKIRERIEEEITSCEWFWGIEENGFNQEVLADFAMCEEHDVLLEEILEETVKCKYYHQLFDPIWKRLGNGNASEQCEVVNLVWDVTNQGEE